MAKQQILNSGNKDLLAWIHCNKTLKQHKTLFASVTQSRKDRIMPYLRQLGISTYQMVCFAEKLEPYLDILKYNATKVTIQPSVQIYNSKMFGVIVVFPALKLIFIQQTSTPKVLSAFKQIFHQTDNLI